MFEMIAFVFLVVNGQQATEPALPPLGYKKTLFASEELCRNYFDTEEGAVAKNQLMSFVSQKLEGKPFTVGIKCVAKEDNSI